MRRSFPNFFPSFPLSDSYRDIVLWIIDASRNESTVLFEGNNELADTIYNQRYYHYSRKCLHSVFRCVAVHCSCSPESLPGSPLS